MGASAPLPELLGVTIILIGRAHKDSRGRDAMSAGFCRKNQLRENCLNAKSRRSTRCCEKLNSAATLIQRTTTEAPRDHMYYIGLDVHKRTISYCVKDAAGHVHQEGKIGSTRRELDAWIKTLPQPRMIAMEATIFTGWIYDHLLPHAEKV